jgi:DNA-binding helix-hairpin-helix protein with protein kinase domain
VVVAQDGRVRLIDCDSFQIDAGGTLHRCEVGVGHFTPPELQGFGTFRGVTRSARHDDFGLALLQFHLLLGGRHPFAGVPVADAAADEPTLEDDIRALRYAYAPDAAQRGRRPPPRSVPMTLLPPAVQAMFTQAFTEPGRNQRPTAAQWQAALDALHASLRRCGADPLHAYPPHLPTCPWCALAACGVIHFLPRALREAGAQPAAELAALWARIEAVAPPPPLELPLVPVPAATPLPADVPDARRARVWRALPLLFAAALLAWAPTAWPFVLLVAALGWLVAGSFITLPRLRERNRRQQALATAQQALAQQQARAEAEAGVAGFAALRARLAQARAVCEARSVQPAARALRQRATVAARWQELQRGPQRLRAFVQVAGDRQRAHRAALHAALRARAQAERDLDAFDHLLR